MKLFSENEHKCDLRPVFWRCKGCEFQLGDKDILDAIQAVEQFNRNDAMLLSGILKAEFGDGAKGFIEKLGKFSDILKE